MSLHDLSQAARFADRIVLLHHGRMVADGPPAVVLTPESIASVFGVDAEILTTAQGLPVVAAVRVRDGGAEPEE
jgi:iron complex transport system ATP-binding protein